MLKHFRANVLKPGLVNLGRSKLEFDSALTRPSEKPDTQPQSGHVK